MLDELIKYRTKAMGSAPSNRSPRIYHKRHEQKNINIHQVALEDQMSGTTDPMVQQYWKSIINMNKNAHFQSKRKL
jgi:hypothetical protein